MFLDFLAFEGRGGEFVSLQRATNEGRLFLSRRNGSFTCGYKLMEHKKCKKKIKWLFGPGSKW
jgi:hypothetical protein